MIYEHSFIFETIVDDITYREVCTEATDSSKPNQIEIFHIRFIGDKMIKEKETHAVGGETKSAKEADLDDDELDNFEEQWETNWPDDYDLGQYTIYMNKHVAKMEVNGTVLCQEKSMDLRERENVVKRSIGDKSITVRKPLPSKEAVKKEADKKEVEKRSGAELRARFHELRDFEKEWTRLWNPDEYSKLIESSFNVYTNQHTDN